MDFSCRCMSCVMLNSKRDKAGNKLPLTPMRKQLQMDWCQNKNTIKMKTSASSFRTKIEANFSMEIKSNIVVKVQPNIEARTISRMQSRIETKVQSRIETKTQSRTETRIQSTQIESKRIESKWIEHRVASPVRNYSPIAKNLKAIDSARKTVTKTPIKLQPTNEFKTQSKLNQSVPVLGPKSKSIAENQKTKDSDSKSFAAEPKNKNEVKNTGKNEADQNIDLNTVPEAVPEENTPNDTNELSSSKNDPSPAELPIEHLENIDIKQEEISEVQDVDETEYTQSDDIQITSSQSKWTEEVVKLLNTGSEMDISIKLATIGPKTAALITKCREVRGEFEQIEDLQKGLGWSDKVYKRFIMKNFL